MYSYASTLSRCMQSLYIVPSRFSHFDIVKHELQKIKVNRPIKYPRMYPTKHKDPKYKRMRERKFIKIIVPDFQENTEQLSPQDMRIKAKEQGIPPPRYWNEKPIHISSSTEYFDPYIPPEGDGKMSFVSYEGSKQKVSLLEKKGRSMLAVRKIKSFDENFDIKVFPSEALKIFIEAHESLMEMDADKLHTLVTEKAYPEIVFNTKLKTIRWKFLESVEAARVVHVRCSDILEKNNVFAQITVRFHTKQTLAIYDRFGRLEHGSETVAKDILEYVVFEKYIANEYGIWRIHGKIIPSWIPPKEPRQKTFVKPKSEDLGDKPNFTEQVQETVGSEKDTVKVESA